MAAPQFPYVSRPLNFGHRGAPHAAPENTLVSFQKAREMGADGVELDVLLCADGEVVVMHDSTVERTTDGHGRISDLTLAQVKALDAGARFGPPFVGERVPTLREVAGWAQNDVLLNIELKSSNVRSEPRKKRGAEYQGLEEKVIAIIREYGLEGRVILSSFNPGSIWRVRRLAPDLQTGLLYAMDLPIFLSRAWLRPLARPNALHPHYEMVGDAYMGWARHKGYHVNVWTPDHTLDLQRLIDQKVDAIITNRPDRLATMLKR
jgi:glycerophosphoryl diester phosphodiesterase